MSSLVGGASIEAILASLAADLDALAGVDLDEVAARPKLDLYRHVEVCRRRLDAEATRVLGAIDRTQAYADDGHRRPQGFVKHVARCTTGEASGRVRVARALGRLPRLAEAAGEGAVPADHLRVVGSVAANPRITELVDDADEFFADHACTDTAETFAHVAKHWQRLADVDGPAPADTARRDFSIRQMFDGWFRVTGTLPPIVGAHAAAVLSQFEDAEFQDDWAAVVAEHGEGANPDLLPRTAGQRRADAAAAIFIRAASAPPGEAAPPVVNIVVDHDTLLDGAADLFGAPAPPRDPSRAGDVVCRTIDGFDLPPSAVALAAFTGLVRRVITDGPSSVIDLGRRRRLFTGAARDAVMIQDAIDNTHGPTCRWPGCCVTLPRCHVDHRRGWADDGPTDPGNGQMLCPAHNQLKEHGFTPTRGPDGTWRHQRPDGTDITPAT